MQKISSAKIKEIFTSLQGEGPYVGELHDFVRFCYCNLNCLYCDTDFNPENAKEYSIEELFSVLIESSAQVISFTGGEPLIETPFLIEFLKKYKKKLNKKIYLETNATLFDKLADIIDYIDIISADIKLKSATGEDTPWDSHDKFLKAAIKKETFLKVVFDNSITDDEIEKSAALAKKYNLLIVLQPKMPMDKGLELNRIFDKFYQKYQNIRLIPQVHKFLNVQ